MATKPLTYGVLEERASHARHNPHYPIPTCSICFPIAPEEDD